MVNTLYKIAVIVVFLSYFGNNNAYCAELTPEELTHNFYTWYINELSKRNKRSPVFDDNIYKYVDKDSVHKLRTHFCDYFSTNYFTKSQDFGENELLNGIKIHKYKEIDKDFGIVPVSFDVCILKYGILVFVKKQNSIFSIVAVEDPAFLLK